MELQLWVPWGMAIDSPPWIRAALHRTCARGPRRKMAENQRGQSHSLHSMADPTLHPTTLPQMAFTFDTAPPLTSHVPLQRPREAGVMAQFHFRERAWWWLLGKHQASSSHVSVHIDFCQWAPDPSSLCGLLFLGFTWRYLPRLGPCFQSAFVKFHLAIFFFKSLLFVYYLSDSSLLQDHRKCTKAKKKK